jgi:hypothetical protein
MKGWKGPREALDFGVGRPLTVERRGADEEATDALSLTLRFFFNKRDGIALEQMRSLYNSLPITEEDKQMARDAFGRFDQFLTSGIGVVFQGKSLTNRNILETVLFGDLAHVNDDKKPIFEEWQKAVPFGEIVKFHYEDAVANVIQIVAGCQQFNERILRRLIPDSLTAHNPLAVPSTETPKL